MLQADLTAPLSRAELLPPELPSGTECLAQGRELARDWTSGGCAFLEAFAVASEADYKRRCMREEQIMLHAQLGLRDADLTRTTWAQVHERCAARGVRIDRYGVCLDWSMGYPRELRDGYPRGTGVLLADVDDFVALTAAAPVAPHFGDFVLGFPAALENTQAALAAGATSIGNLGQYFTFNLRYWDDDVASTTATLRALGLIAAQPVEVLVHSNLDDGFGARFSDLACLLGAALIEQHIVQTLCGCRLSHCYGHHFSEPSVRWAFQQALAAISTCPGTMVYGDTMSYTGSDSENFASLGGYLLVDILAQWQTPTGHALNAVPVSENQRIPDGEEIIAAQLYAARLIDRAAGYRELIDPHPVADLARQLLDGARLFQQRVMQGFGEAGISEQDPAELLLALRRIGARRLEALFGPGAPEPDAPGRRRPVVPAGTLLRLQAQAEAVLQCLDAEQFAALQLRNPMVLVATTDVHEHGKWLVERILQGLALRAVDGGVSVDPDVLARQAADVGPDVIAVSTYNGMALDYFQRLQCALHERGLNIPVVLGGRLNQIPDNSNTSLPVDVCAELRRHGASVCADVSELAPMLVALTAGPETERA